MASKPMIEHASAQQNYLDLRNVGEVQNANAIGRKGSLICGAILRFTLCINEDQQITDVRFKVLACSNVIAACSRLAESIKGMTTAQAGALARDTVENGFPPERSHCAGLANEALLTAVQGYSDSVRAGWSGSDALICTCFGLSENTIELEIRAGGLTTIEEVGLACNAGRGCGSCNGLIQDILDEER